MLFRNKEIVAFWNQRIGRSFFSGSAIRSRSFCHKWIYDLIQSFHPPEKRIYNLIFFDIFRSFPSWSLLFIQMGNFTHISYRSQKFTIFQYSGTVLHLKKKLFLISELDFLNFQWLFNSSWFSLNILLGHFSTIHTWFYVPKGSMVQSWSSGRKWIYDPIPIQKKDLDPILQYSVRNDHVKCFKNFHILRIWKPRPVSTRTTPTNSKYVQTSI